MVGKGLIPSPPFHCPNPKIHSSFLKKIKASVILIMEPAVIKSDPQAESKFFSTIHKVFGEVANRCLDCARERYFYI